jgi:hypothetical protein
MVKNVYWCSCTCYICSVVIKLEFYRQPFEKYSNFTFHENTLSGSRVVPCGQSRSSYLSLFAILRKRLTRSSQNLVGGTKVKTAQNNAQKTKSGSVIYGYDQKGKENKQTCTPVEKDK